MKILQLTCHFSPNVGGVESHMDDLVSILARKGFDIFVLTYRPLMTNVRWKLYERKKNLKIFRIPWIAGFFNLFADKPLYEFLYLLPGIFFITPFVLMKQKSDVIHAHGIIAGFVGMFWGKVFRKKTVISLHSIYQFPKSGLYRESIIFIFKHVDSVLCLSKQSSEEIESLGIDRNNIHIFTYWINQKLFFKRKNAKRILHLHEKFVVLFVGRLVSEKGIKVLLESASKWNKNIYLVIVGTGPLEAFVQKQVSKNIIFAGKITQQKLPYYYSASDVLIVPSTHEEGFGRVIIESFACGTPVIGANRGGIPEVITQAVGYTIPISVNTIKNTVAYCFDNHIELKNKSRQAEHLVQKYYSEKNVNTILKAYGE